MNKNDVELQPIGRPSSNRPSEMQRETMKRNSSIIEAYQRLKGEVENKVAAEKSRKTSRISAGKDSTVPRPKKAPGNNLFI